MDSATRDYRWQIGCLEDNLAIVLDAFEQEFETVEFRGVELSQGRLRAALDELLPQTRRGLADIEPPRHLEDFHAGLSEAVRLCEVAYQTYLNGRGKLFSNAFLESRIALVEALEILHARRDQLPVVSRHWRGDNPAFAATAGASAATGIFHYAATDAHHDYSLFVPDELAPAESRPLIVALHGGYGHGREYLWTWIRPALQAGYRVLAPKSVDVTWSIVKPHIDAASVTGAIEQVARDHAVDRRRVYLTGLSDGGTFSYVLGLLAPEYFAAVAPIAGELHQVAEPLLRRGAGKEVPFYVIHGALDHIFPIVSVRSTCGLLDRLGYNLRFDELPDWGHAYPYRINTERVLPWFAGIVKSGPVWTDD